MTYNRDAAIKDSIRSQMAGHHKGCCTWCGKPVAPPRRSWCSQECVKQHERLALDYRRVVLRRDLGLCQICLLDVVAVDAFLARIKKHLGIYGNQGVRARLRRHRDLYVPGLRATFPLGRGVTVMENGCYFPIYESDRTWRDRCEQLERFQRVMKRQGLLGRTTCWDVDHIVPLVEGGHHSFENLRLLCHRCHLEETKKLLRRKRPQSASGAKTAAL